MTEQEVRAVVEQLLSRLNAGELAMPAAQVPTPARIPAQTPEQDGVIEDIEQVDLRRQYLVENAHDAAAFLAMKERTPARIGVGRAGRGTARRRCCAFRRIMPLRRCRCFPTCRRSSWKACTFPCIRPPARAARSF